GVPTSSGAISVCPICSLAINGCTSCTAEGANARAWLFTVTPGRACTSSHALLRARRATFRMRCPYTQPMLPRRLHRHLPCHPGRPLRPRGLRTLASRCVTAYWIWAYSTPAASLGWSLGALDLHPYPARTFRYTRRRGAGVLLQ